MRRALAIFALTSAWICANGAIWDAVQVFAWARMFAGYTQTMTVGAALRETFDPAKPCELCMSVTKAKDVEQKQLPPATAQAAEKLLLAIDAPEKLVFAQKLGEWSAPPVSRGADHVKPVPVPPPRV